MSDVISMPFNRGSYISSEICKVGNSLSLSIMLMVSSCGVTVRTLSTCPACSVQIRDSLVSVMLSSSMLIVIGAADFVTSISDSVVLKVRVVFPITFQSSGSLAATAIRI